MSESHPPFAAACLAVGAAFALRTVLAAPGTTLTVPLQAQGASGISGAATLSDTGEGLQVEIVLAGGPVGVAQPVHIHAGGCGDDLGDVVYPLEPVLDGTSTTLLRRVSLADVEVGHAINVHRSRDDIATYVACGVVEAPPGGSTPAGPGNSGSVAAPSNEGEDTAAGSEGNVGAGESASGIGGRVESGPAALPRTGRGELLGIAAILGVALGLLGLGLRRRWAI